MPHVSHLHMVRSLDPLLADVIRTTPTSLILQLIIVILIVKKLKKFHTKQLQALSSSTTSCNINYIKDGFHFEYDLF